MTFIAALTVVFAGCGDAGNGDGKVVRDYSDGSRSIRYTEFPADRLIVAEPDLRIGSHALEDAYVFGDIRGVEVGRHGEIYVLDRQASEVRVFDVAGKYLRTVAGKGDGPGEISIANGLLLSGDSVLWVNDTERGRLSGFDPLGGGIASINLPVRSNGHVWTNIFDTDGRYRTMVSHGHPANAYSTGPGLRVREADRFAFSYHPKTGERDSVFLGRISYRIFVFDTGGGSSNMTIPQEPYWMTEFDPAGGFWRAWSHTYEFVRIDEVGDTVLTVQTAIKPVPFTARDRREMILAFEESYPYMVPVVLDALEHAQDRKPVMDRLIVDDMSRLWIRRGLRGDEPDQYDVYTAGGDYLASVRLDFETDRRMPVRIREHRLYVVGPDSSGAPTVIRTSPIAIAGG